MSVGLQHVLKIWNTKDNIEQLAENAVIMKDIEHNTYRYYKGNVNNINMKIRRIK